MEWQHLPPETGCPFTWNDKSQEAQLSMKFGWISSDGTSIFQKADLNLVAQVISVHIH